MGNSIQACGIEDAANGKTVVASFRDISYRRLRRWASRLSLAKSGRGGCDSGDPEHQQQHQQHHQEAQRGIASKWNRASRKRIRRSTLFDPFGSAKAKWPVPFIESLFLPDFPVRGGGSGGGGGGCGCQELDDLEVLDVVAAGAFGNVLKVREEDTKKVYALKVIDKARLVQNGHAVVHQAKEEVSIQGALRGHSRFVASLLRHWQTRKRLYLLLEFFPSGELFARWQQRRGGGSGSGGGGFSEGLARLYVAELACALDFLHSSGVLFRDLKMENVVMDGAGHLVLIDFGLSKWLRPGQSTRTVCGTLAYCAPEMLNGQSYSHGVDWWSLGILFYALVTGKFPLHGARSCREMRQLVSRHRYEAPGGLSWECRYTLERLLQKSPARRLTSLRSLAQSPFFKARIDFDRVRAGTYDPEAFHTQQDCCGRCGGGDDDSLQQSRPATTADAVADAVAEDGIDDDCEEEGGDDFRRLIDAGDSFGSGFLSSRELFGTQL